MESRNYQLIGHPSITLFVTILVQIYKLFPKLQRIFQKLFLKNREILYFVVLFLRISTFYAFYAFFILWLILLLGNQGIP